MYTLCSIALMNSKLKNKLKNKLENRVDSNEVCARAIGWTTSTCSAKCRCTVWRDLSGKADVLPNFEQPEHFVSLLTWCGSKWTSISLVGSGNTWSAVAEGVAGNGVSPALALMHFVVRMDNVCQLRQLAS